MVRFFKKTPVYIKLWRNKVEITNLETKETRTAMDNFSTERNVVANFQEADATIRSVLAELGLKASFFGPQLKVLMQQLERSEGGLSDIEKRALRDLGEMTGASSVQLVEHSHNLTIDDAIKELNKK